MGRLGVSVQAPGEVMPAIERALTHDGPALIDVRTQELVMPPSLEVEQIGGFVL